MENGIFGKRCVYARGCFLYFLFFFLRNSFVVNELLDVMKFFLLKFTNSVFSFFFFGRIREVMKLLGWKM